MMCYYLNVHFQDQRVKNGIRIIRRVGRDSSVGIATRYGLDAPGTESRYGRDFTHPSKTGPGSHPDSYKKGYLATFLRVELPTVGVKYPPACSAKANASVELYHYSASGSRSL